MREAFVFILLTSFLLFLTMHSWFQSSVDQKILDKVVVTKISVTVQGEVKKPGTYFIKPGTPIKKILEKAKPTKNADLKALKTSQKVFENTEINVPLKIKLSTKKRKR